MNRSDSIINILKETGFSILEEGRTLRIRAEGFSMFPSIKPGSLILIEPFLPSDEPRIGEIIAWKRESGFVVHRLVGITEGDNGKYFVTRGDSTGSEDLPVSAKQLAGRVVAVETPAGQTVSPARQIPSRCFYIRNRLLAWLALRRTVMLRIIQKDVL